MISCYVTHGVILKTEDVLLYYMILILTLTMYSTEQAGTLLNCIFLHINLAQSREMYNFAAC